MYTHLQTPIFSTECLRWKLDVAILQKLFGSSWQAEVHKIMHESGSAEHISVTEILLKNKSWFATALSEVSEYGRDLCHTVAGGYFRDATTLSYYTQLKNVFNKVDNWKPGIKDEGGAFEAAKMGKKGYMDFQTIFLPKGGKVPTFAGGRIFLFAVLDQQNARPLTVKLMSVMCIVTHVYVYLGRGIICIHGCAS